MLWLGLAYLGALGALFITSLWDQDAFTGETVRQLEPRQLPAALGVRGLPHDRVPHARASRSLVTVVDIVIAFPIALYMAKVASPRMQKILVIAVLTPLWASYLVKAYAWRIMLSENGIVHDIGNAIGIDTPGYGLAAIVITLAYLWLPFMILPIYAGLERLPDSMLEASADLGARTGHSLRRVVLPTVFPAIVAGSIFTFSLSLGDYITVRIVGGANQMLGNVVYDNVGAANNLPFAAAVAHDPGRDHALLPRRRPSYRRPRQRLGGWTDDGHLAGLPDRAAGRDAARARWSSTRR